MYFRTICSLIAVFLFRHIFFSVHKRFEYKNMLNFLPAAQKNAFFISSVDIERKNNDESKQKQPFLCLELNTFFQVQQIKTARAQFFSVSLRFLLNICSNLNWNFRNIAMEFEWKRVNEIFFFIKLWTLLLRVLPLNVVFVCVNAVKFNCFGR